jgi:hypothetical protein
MMSFRERYQFVVRVGIANQMRERVNAGARQVFGVVEIEHMRDHLGLQLVRLVDHRAI